ncbi:hypothetical protein AYJ54_28690 [Bradyrhizobium centrolobii]|uniref:Uncharacterized protein n=1 Tax=Bradyrhizobium centrolobii TaxID=1505087 RepID=A0A176YCR2_9BRAD|nr:hypothetical protein AYJ54_28690 [Bradyrhizobium centrolobii]
MKRARRSTAAIALATKAATNQRIIRIAAKARILGMAGKNTAIAATRDVSIASLQPRMLVSVAFMVTSSR